MRSHVDGTMETVKFRERRKQYYENLDQMIIMGHSIEDYLHYFPAFVGTLTLNRYLTLYELYKKTLGISGHIAEIGVFKGAGSILFGKLIQMFEPDSLTMVHGFDWFKGTEAVEENPLQVQGGNTASESTVLELIRLQNLENTVKIHNVNVEAGLPSFFEKYPHLQFKLVFLDSGTYECVSESINHFWPRLIPGGIMVFDQFNNEVAPGETRAVREFLPYEKIENIQNSWMPSAFVIKK